MSRSSVKPRFNLNAAGEHDLAAAVAHWLEYQVLCLRGMLLSEGYLAHPIGEFLRLRLSGAVHAEHPHPAFRTEKQGKPRLLDYAVQKTQATRNDDALALALALEAKFFTARKGDTAERIVADILRLEALARRADGRYFPVSGDARGLARRFDELGVNNTGLSPKPHVLPEILPLTLHQKMTVAVQRARPRWLRRLFATFADSHQVALPTSYVATLVASAAAGESRARLWKIQSVSKRATFVPDDAYRNA